MLLDSGSSGSAIPAFFAWIVQKLLTGNVSAFIGVLVLAITYGVLVVLVIERLTNADHVGELFWRGRKLLDDKDTKE